jgi:acyl-CoA hydrolase
MSPTLIYNMNFRTRKLIKPGDLNARGTLFGGQVLKWIDEEAAIFAICQLGERNIVTKAMSEINFISTAKTGDIAEIGCELISFGTTSITIACEPNRKTHQTEGDPVHATLKSRACQQMVRHDPLTASVDRLCQSSLQLLGESAIDHHHLGLSGQQQTEGV